MLGEYISSARLDSESRKLNSAQKKTRTKIYAIISPVKVEKAHDLWRVPSVLFCPAFIITQYGVR